MTTGLATSLANGMLNAAFGSTTLTAPTTVYLKFHTGDPGSAGTANAASLTTRTAITFGAAASGSIGITGSPTATATATETLSHGSLWTAATGGTFLDSYAFTTARGVQSGDTINVSSISISLGALAA